MPEHDGLMRIFWPLDIPKSDSPGVIVGWRNSGLDVFVVAILEDVDVSGRSADNQTLTDVGPGTECRKCSESWDTVSQCHAPHRTNI